MIYAPSFFQTSDVDYIPKLREISEVSQDIEALVTTTEDHGYEVGQLVRLHVEPRYGMSLDGVNGRVLTVPNSTSFTVDINTTSLFPYVTPVYSNGNGFTQSHVVPITGVGENSAR